MKLAAAFFFTIVCSPLVATNHTTSAPHVLVLHESLLVEPGTTLAFVNTILINLAQFPFVLADSTSSVILDNCTIILNDNYQWSVGTLYIKGICHILGPHAWHQNAHRSCIINTHSTLILGNEATFYYQPEQPDSAGLILTDYSSTLILNHGHLRSGMHGLTLSSGTISIEGTCTLHAENRNPQRGICFDNITLNLNNPNAQLIVIAPYFQEKKHQSLTQKAVTFLGNTALALALCTAVMTITTQLSKYA